MKRMNQLLIHSTISSYEGIQVILYILKSGLIRCRIEYTGRSTTHMDQHYITLRVKGKRCYTMSILRVYKRNSTFNDVADLVEEISKIGLIDALEKYHNKPLEKEARSIVAGPSFLQFLNKLFQIHLSAGDIIQFESGNEGKYYMLSATGTWDEVIKLQ